MRKESVASSNHISSWNIRPFPEREISQPDTCWISACHTAVKSTELLYWQEKVRNLSGVQQNAQIFDVAAQVFLLTATNCCYPYFICWYILTYSSGKVSRITAIISPNIFCISVSTCICAVSLTLLWRGFTFLHSLKLPCLHADEYFWMDLFLGYSRRCASISFAAALCAVFDAWMLL